MLKRLVCLTIITVLAMIAAGSAAAEADEPPLPSYLRWGDSRERCEELLYAEGYLKFVRAENYTSSKSPDRLLKRVREGQGISALEFRREQKGVTETLKIHLYKNNLFQIEIMFDNTKQSFADSLVDDISRSAAKLPRFVEGKDSKMQMYIWAFPVTVILFTYRYGPSAPFDFAALEYRNEPLLGELKSKGLM